MRIIYFSHTFFADCDFPLIRELQRQGHDVRYYLPISSFDKKSTLINIKKLYPHTGIYPSSIYDEFSIYKNEIDLNNLFIVNHFHKQKYHPLNLLLSIRLVFHFIRLQPDVIHFTNPPSLLMKLIYMFNQNLVLTLHDPFLHSGKITKRKEKDRIIAFKKIPKIIILNKKQVNEFVSYYKIPKDHIYQANLGMYDSITRIIPNDINHERDFILFFGLVSPYKGIEYLLEAMIKVHNVHPHIKLIIAGGGEYYFDISKYSHLDYIEIRNYYIEMPQLACLLRNCLFAVCPYKDATQSGVVQTAFSMNVPLVVTDVGNMSESVQNGVFGFVVPPKDITSLANAINMLIEQPNLLMRMRNNIENQWKKEMEWGPIADKYIECYKN